jgi:general secretion pathway protein A
MPLETLEQIRLLSNLEANNEKLLQIILVGQKEFDEMLSSKELGQIRQRIGVRRTLEPLGPEESLDYIRHRLSRVTDDPDSVFTRKALRRIIKHSQGIPRKINIICDNALITTMGHGGKSVSSRIVEEVAADLDGRPMKSRLRPVLAAVGVLLTVLLGAGWLVLSPHPVASRIVQLDALRSFFHASPGEQTAPPEQVVQNESQTAQDKTSPLIASPEQLPPRAELNTAPEKPYAAPQKSTEPIGGVAAIDKLKSPAPANSELQAKPHDDSFVQSAQDNRAEFPSAESKKSAAIPSDSLGKGPGEMRSIDGSPIPEKEPANKNARRKGREPAPTDVIDWVLKERSK